jgi:hypothetical protein
MQSRRASPCLGRQVALNFLVQRQQGILYGHRLLQEMIALGQQRR